MAEENTEGWGWETWAEDFVVQATSKVSDLLEKVENQLGIPDPNEMAKLSLSENEGNQVSEKEGTTQAPAVVGNDIPKEDMKEAVVTEPTGTYYGLLFDSRFHFQDIINISIISSSDLFV